MKVLGPRILRHPAAFCLFRPEMRRSKKNPLVYTCLSCIFHYFSFNVFLMLCLLLFVRAEQVLERLPRSLFFTLVAALCCWGYILLYIFQISFRA